MFIKNSQVGQPMLARAARDIETAQHLKDQIISLQENNKEAYNLLHQYYVSGYNSFPEKIKQEFPKISEELSITDNPFVSASETPWHAIRYALGDKFNEQQNVLYPCYKKNGVPKNPILGKVYIFLIPLQELKKRDVFRVVEAFHNPGQFPRLNKCRHSELEAIFPGFVEAQYVAYEHPIEVPNFKTHDRPQSQEKFGLDDQSYQYFRREILKTKGKFHGQKNIYNKLIKKILPTIQHTLLQKARVIAAYRQCQRIYLNLARLPCDKKMMSRRDVENSKLNNSMLFYTRLLKDVSLNCGDLNVRNNKGATALMRICQNEDISEAEAYHLVAHLIEKGANVNIGHRRLLRGGSPSSCRV